MVRTQLIYRTLLFSTLFLPVCLPVKAQIVPTIIQQLSFGTFSPGNGGGTITISPAGVRSATGDLIIINQNGTAYMPATIEIEAPVGSRIAIVNSSTQLSRSDGKTMILNINGSDPLSPFTTTMQRTNISIGGTLTVGNILMNPSGRYTGLFIINFILE